MLLAYEEYIQYTDMYLQNDNDNNNNNTNDNDVCGGVECDL